MEATIKISVKDLIKLLEDSKLDKDGYNFKMTKKDLQRALDESKKKKDI